MDDVHENVNLIITLLADNRIQNYDIIRTSILLLYFISHNNK